MMKAALVLTLSGMNVTEGVLIASAEDGLADTVRPRLDRMGARVDRIHAIDQLFDLDEPGFERLEAAVFEIYPVLLEIASSLSLQPVVQDLCMTSIPALHFLNSFP